MKRIVTILLVIMLAASAKSQNGGSACMHLLDQEEQMSGTLWLNTCNAVGLCIDSLPEIRRFEFFYHHTDGDFNRAAEADLSNLIGFRTFGIKKTGKAILSGSFDYDRAYEKNADWYMRFDPSETNPFYIADSIGGDWLKDRFKTSFSIASINSFHGFHAGLKTEYHVGLGGRDNDPRPQSLWMNLRIYPSVTWKSQNGWFTGITAIIGSKREDIDVMNKYGVGGNAIFKVNGLMQYGSPLVKSTLSYRFDALQLGGAIQAGRQTCYSKWFAELEYLNTFEDATQSPYASNMDDATKVFTSTAIRDAAFEEHYWRVYAGTKLRMRQKTIVLGFTGINKNSKSYLYENEQVEYQSRNIDLSVTGEMYFGQEGHTQKSIGMQLGSLHHSAENFFYATQLIAMWGGEMHAHYTKDLAGGWSAGLIFTTGGFFDNGSKLNISPTTPFIPARTEITSPVVIHDFNILSKSYLTEQAQLEIYFPPLKQQRLYLKASSGWLIPGKAFKSLWNAECSFGMLF